MTKINRNQSRGEKDLRKPRILVAPLDWGLGHATRCIPVIYELLNNKTEVWLAAEGAIQDLLKQEFPDLPLLPLEGYRVRYGRSGIKRLVFQFPRLWRAVNNEHAWLKNAVNKYGFDAVISDNRFGLYHSSIPTIFITHQLAIKSPFGKWTEPLLRKLNYRFINRFTTCWIPDKEPDQPIAGALSHPVKKPAIPCVYIGLLSRLKRSATAEKKGHLFISLSGPEPQRTIFENNIIDQVSHYNGTATVVRGLPSHASIIPSTNDIRFYNHLSAGEYNVEMERAEYVISRSGYSTIMDLVTLGKKSILVPTPGQPEQEYLATRMEQLQVACCCSQKDFVLQSMLKKASVFSYQLPVINDGRELSNAVSAFLSLRAGRV